MKITYMCPTTENEQITGNPYDEIHTRIVLLLYIKKGKRLSESS